MGYIKSSFVFKDKRLPGLESWNRFRDSIRISTGLEPCGKTRPKTERFWGTGRIVLCVAAGRALFELLGRAPQALTMSAVKLPQKA